ncbi:7-carboxy-7-deazaguanine synthase QueE [Blastopirellula sp. J2-11]|uniref:7-carboxy-7-deazaguanine synthase QueE n=1 Tax=Blastopirellula sp. J2-11 TaxID=2943192 RepID=UPI0021C77B11|nr:7-carboxy-7-deazaguanine synthase QueE [Blastopirellula sp. J2-11]UUO07917.1 7-carboxy-7-deazaguanine synthase QueE [Blastopirellula sp. J2-11]
MRIAEIYRSIQGEGALTGVTSTFVRASGCNLRCWFCDTPHASWRPEGEDLSVAEILGRIALLDCDHVVLTGGEPMLFAEMIPLCEGIRTAGRHITIETAGTLYLPLACDVMSISPKMSNSAPPLDDHPRWHRRHEQTRKAPEVIRQLIEEHAYQFKFVIDRAADAEEVLRYLDRYPQIDRATVFMMPQGTEASALEAIRTWLEPWCDQHQLQFGPRRQIEWFGALRGT